MKVSHNKYLDLKRNLPEREFGDILKGKVLSDEHELSSILAELIEKCIRPYLHA